MLQKRFQVSRNQLRNALGKLEFYGVLKRIPQSGTYVAKLGVHSLEGLISNILKIEDVDLLSLIDTRTILEIHCAELAAKNIKEEEIKILIEIHESLKDCVCKMNSRGLDDDIYFHLKIAEFSHSSVLSSLITLIVPEIIRISEKIDSKKTQLKKRLNITIEEHELILNAIKNRDSKKAAKMMEIHMKETEKMFNN